ncbi:MAG: NifB/NifX family molybdenum-iron cluster-binding protein [Chloroflexi bacterium]|jgi:predicted Fe-Mo cluster-binding NifX family protein|nr:NifB/NifX family molybdenum-iron cluster-binding protein [Chloroflexota bacterium]
MKIVLSATGPGFEAAVDERFGRCPYFLYIDSETLEIEATDNPGEKASGGAGIVAAQAVADKDVKAVLTGHIGPNAHEVLSKAGIKMFTDVTGKVREAVESFKSGNLKESTGPTVAGHFGKGPRV